MCTIWPFCLWQGKEGQSSPLYCVVNRDFCTFQMNITWISRAQNMCLKKEWKNENVLMCLILILFTTWLLPTLSKVSFFNKNSTSFFRAGLTLIWSSRFNVWDTILTGQNTLLRLILLTNDQLKSVLLPKTPSCEYEQSTKHTLQNHDWSTWDSVWMCCWEEKCKTGQRKTWYLSHLKKHYQYTLPHHFVLLSNC